MNIKYIFLGKECFCYKLIEYCRKKDIAVLDLYKNKYDFKNDKILRTIDVQDWSTHRELE